MKIHKHMLFVLESPENWSQFPEDTDKKVVLQTLIVWKKSLVHYFLRDTNKFASFWSEVKYINSMYVRILHGSLRNSNILTKNSTKGLIRKKKNHIYS